MNMIEAMEKFIQYIQDQDLSALTVKGYKSDLHNFIQWYKESNDDLPGMEHITPTDIKEYKQYLLVVKRRKASTINRRLAALSAWMDWALDQRVIEIDPTEKIRMIKKEADAPKWLDKREQFALQRAIEKDLQISKIRYPKRWLTRRRDASMSIFMLNTGLRLNECITLHLGDVRISSRKGLVMVLNGKGGKEREVPLNTEARKAVEAWLNVRPGKGEYLWVAVESDEDGKLTGRTVQRMLKRYAQEAGLDELTPHMLRHTFAKNLVNNNVGLATVAKLLGHSKLDTTKVYITPDKKDLESAVEKLTP